jgi:flagellar hook-associated protein 3 FlgL
MMRVTQGGQSRLALGAIATARARLLAAQQVAMSGKRVTKPSDDPAAAARNRLLGELEAKSASYRTTAQYGRSRLESAEQALAEAGNVLIRARQLATAMANGSMSVAERTAAATEVAQLRSSMTDLVNTQYGDEYVFAHVATNDPPYDDATGFTYDVDTYAAVREAEVGPGQNVEIGASGSLAFAQRAATPGSVDVVGVLDQLAADLAANDVPGIQAGIDRVAAAFDQVLAERTRTGVRMEELSRADEAADQNRAVYTRLRSELMDADAAEAFSRLSLAENTLQAAVTVASRVLGPSLLGS